MIDCKMIDCKILLKLDTVLLCSGLNSSNWNILYFLGRDIWCSDVPVLLCHVSAFLFREFILDLPLMPIGGRAEGLACVDPGARTPISVSGNFFSLTDLTLPSLWEHSDGLT